MDEKTKQMEDKSLMEFEGEISPHLIDKKIDLLRKKQEQIKNKIFELEVVKYRAKLGSKTMQEIETEWNEKSPNERYMMAREVPAFNSQMFERRLNGWRNEEINGLFSREFRETGEFDNDSPMGLFEKYCKKK